MGTLPPCPQVIFSFIALRSFIHFAAKGVLFWHGKQTAWRSRSRAEFRWPTWLFVGFQLQL